MMKKLMMTVAMLILTANLFAGTVIVKIKKPNGETQRTVLDTNQKIANMLIFMQDKGKIKMKMHTSGVGTFAEASKQKPYFFIWYEGAPEFGMYMWKSDFYEVTDEMLAGKYN